MNKRIIAIDPGKNGAICVREGSEIIDVVKMPETCADLRDHIEAVVSASALENIEVIAYLEQVSAMPGQGVTSMFTFGNQYGHLEQVLADFRVRTIKVRPQVWQKALSLNSVKDKSKADHKRRLKDYAQQLFPSVKVTSVNQDALLISEYAIRQER